MPLAVFILVNLRREGGGNKRFFKGTQEDLRWQMAWDPTLWQTSSLTTSVYAECSRSLTTDLGRQQFRDICLVLCFSPFSHILPDEIVPVSFQSSHLGKVKTPGSWFRATAFNCCTIIPPPLTGSPDMTPLMCHVRDLICLQ